ncbi:unnamed protein product [Rhizophagus irregularis]|nr:unnamed protein product [Rhizophagus irregularis]
MISSILLSTIIFLTARQRNFCHVQSTFRLFFLGPIHEEAEFTLMNTSPDKPLKTTLIRLPLLTPLVSVLQISTPRLWP